MSVSSDIDCPEIDCKIDCPELEKGEVSQVEQSGARFQYEFQ